MKLYLIFLCGIILMGGCASRRTPEFHVRLAGRYFQNGQYERCADECQKALLEYPYHKEAQYNLGNAYVKMDQLDQALNAFQQAVWIQETYPQPHYGLAVVYSRKGEFKKAYKEIQRYLELVPGDETARKLRDHIKENMK